jgi:preprotein translocase subunit YajC
MKYLYYKLNYLISMLQTLVSILIFFLFFCFLIIIQQRIVAKTFVFILSKLMEVGIW